MIKKLKAFTFAELMITLAVMGVLASIMLPVISSIRPDKTKATFKKAYYVVERTVYDMVTDDSLYPELGSYVGFDNTQQVTYNGQSYSGNTKFVKLFAAHVNKISRNSPTGASIPNDGVAGTPNIVTSDGIAYYIPSNNFSGFGFTDKTNENPKEALAIMVDVNGANAKPNKVGVDRFFIYIKADGRICVKDGTAAGNKAASYIGTMNIQRD